MISHFKTALIASAVALALAGCNDNSADPRILSKAPTQAVEDQQVTYSIKVENAANATFELVQAPAGMTISSDGVVTWTPTEGVLSSGEVHVQITTQGKILNHKFVIVVSPVNDAPVFESVEAQTAYSGELFTLQLVVNDPDDANNGQDLSYELITAPEGMTISDRGAIAFTSQVTESQLGQVKVKVADGGEDNAQPGIVSFALDEVLRYFINGNVANYYNNLPVAGSDVVLAANGEVVDRVVSDENGDYSLFITDRLLGERMTVSADAVGYREAAKTVSFEEMVFEQALFLPPVHHAQLLDPSQAQELAVQGQVLVSLPANSLVDSDGNAVVGDVTAELTIINPSADINLMPGDMVTPDETNALVPIESFGAITATFTDANGDELQLAEGQSANIRIPVSGTNPPATIPLYYYDPISGYWIEEGEATLDADGLYYVGTVNHFTTWNADRRYETTFVTGCVADKTGARVANARINSEGLDYNGRSSSYSNIDGDFSIPVRINSTQLVSATFGQESRVQTVVTENAELTLSECLMLDTSSTQIILRWGQNPTDLDSHFYGPDGNGGTFHVYYGYKQVSVNDKLIFLDVDDTSSFGPEVISLYDFPVAGTYAYYVNDYRNQNVDTWESARVSISIDGRSIPFTPPEGVPNNMWHVFNIEVSEGGEATVIPVNQWASPSIQAMARSATPLRALTQPQATLFDKLLKQKYYAK